MSASDKRKRLEQIIGDGEDTRPEQEEAFFATECPDSQNAEYALLLRQCQFGLFGLYAEDGQDFVGSSDDIHVEIAKLSVVTGMGKKAVENAMCAYMRLQELPMLRDLQRETQRLDLSRLIAIDNQLARLGNDITDEMLAAFDELLAGLFSPTSVNQQLPTPWTIKSRMKKLLASFDPNIDYCSKKKKEREQKEEDVPPGHCSVSFSTENEDVGNARMHVVGDSATMASIRAFVEETAREHKISLADATVKLLTGEITPAAKAVIYGYAPKKADGSIDCTASVYIPRFGWTTAPGTAMFHQMADANGTVVDLDSEKLDRAVAGYEVPEDIKAKVRWRDGKCVWPGCHVPAENCQMEHRISYGEGGLTKVDNLYCLCQHHHNIKTDKRAYYLPDPVTGEVVWLLPDGTYMKSEPEGFIQEQVLAENPRWKTTLRGLLTLRRNATRFFALAHTIMDKYESGGSYDECVSALEEVEAKYGMSFPFHPTPPPPVPDLDFEPPQDPMDDRPTVQDLSMERRMRLPS